MYRFLKNSSGRPWLALKITTTPNMDTARIRERYHQLKLEISRRSIIISNINTACSNPKAEERLKSKRDSSKKNRYEVPRNSSLHLSNRKKIFERGRSALNATQTHKSFKNKHIFYCIDSNQFLQPLLIVVVIPKFLPFPHMFLTAFVEKVAGEF